MRDAYGRTWVGFGKLFRAQRHRANRLFGVPLPLHSYIRSAHSGTAPPPLQSGAGVVVRTQPPLRTGTLGAQSYVLLPGTAPVLRGNYCTSTLSHAVNPAQGLPSVRNRHYAQERLERSFAEGWTFLCFVHYVLFRVSVFSPYYRDDETSHLE